MKRTQRITLSLITILVVVLAGGFASRTITIQASPLVIHQHQQVGPQSNRFRPVGGGFGDIGAGLAGTEGGNAAWGDYDNDGRLDVIITGYTLSTTPSAIIYHNDGNGHFSDINANLPGIVSGSAAWGDYDNDGKLDLIISGGSYTYGALTRIYHNDGNGVFSDAGANIIGLEFTSIAWADYDKDGRLDFAISGQSYSNPQQNLTRLYHNEGGGRFTDVNAGLPGLSNGHVAWGDYDNDGYPDLLIAGDTGYKYITKVYHNNGNGTFGDIYAPILEASGAVAWGDYNNDGRLDIAIAGYDGHGLSFRIYRNDGGGIFTDIGANLIGLYNDSLMWGDYDNDGFPDLLATGMTSGNSVTNVYHNNQDGTFTDINAGLDGVVGSAAWGDYNNDGKLDILITGFDNSGNKVTRIYQNNTSDTNAPPTAPTGLLLDSIAADTATLSWQAASDDHTPGSALRYNLRVGTVPGGSDVVGPMAGATSGYRRLPQLGNASAALTTVIKGLRSNTTYYWSVQAIDGALAGGPFAQEANFTTGIIPPTPTGTSTPAATNTPEPPSPTWLPPTTATPQPTVCWNPFQDIEDSPFFHAINTLYCRGVVNGESHVLFGPHDTATRAQFAKIVVLAFALPLVTPLSRQTFTDVPPGSFAYLYIESGYAQGILNGFAPDNCQAHNATYPCFLPNLDITRGQLTKLVVNAAHYPLLTPVGGGSTFDDVPPQYIFYQYIETAYAHHAISGYGDGTFRPETDITRDQMCQIVYNAQPNQTAFTPSATPTPAATSTLTDSATPTLIPTATPSVTDTPTPAATNTPTLTPTP